MKLFSFIFKKLTLYKKPIAYTIILTLLIMLEFLTSAFTYSENIHQGLEANLIRLHVIANSDSDIDQAVKLKVRDEILSYMCSKSVDFKTTEEAKKLILDNMKEIEELAAQTLRNNGFNYSAKVYFGEYDFPTKIYGDVTLPAGEYQSLRVVLGNGSGKNWWCVMFPPLCFVDASKGVVPESSKSQLQGVLTDEEYKLALSNAPDSDSEIKIKFKIVELLQQSKIKLASLRKQ